MEAPDGPLVDVGAGTGAFSWWLGRRLGCDTHIVDNHDVPDEQIRVSYDPDGRGTGLLAVVRPG